MADIPTDIPIGIGVDTTGIVDGITKFALAAGYPLVYGVLLVFMMFIAYTWLKGWADK